MRQRTKIWQILLLALTFAFLAIWSWRKTANTLIDFGGQLYIPWQIASGKLLYQDVAYLPGGPFSQLFNAALFKLFGTSLTTLMLANLTILGALLTSLFRFFKKLSDATCATAVCFVVITAFGFSELIPVANYNYVTPYCHETYHGLVLSTFAVLFLSHWVLDPKKSFLFGGGLCVGLVFLTKPDIFIAAGLTTIAAFAFYWRNVADKGVWTRALTCFLGAAALPATLFFLYFQHYQGPSEAFRSVAWAWVPLLTTNAANNKFYFWVLGLEHPIGNTFIAFMQFISVSIALGLCVWCARSEQRSIRKNIFRGMILAILMVIVWRTDWKEGGRVLLFLVPAIGAVLVRHWWKSREQQSQIIPAILWSVFALGMMVKMGLFTKIWHYGVFLGMPGVVLATYFTFGFLPGYLPKWHVDPKTLRTIFAVLVLAIAIKLWSVSNATYSIKTRSMGSGGDQIHFYQKYFDPTGTLLAEGLEWIEKNTPPDATLAVLPQGVMLNYLSRRINPTPYTTFVFPEWQAFGEETILSAYDRSRPDFIAITRFDGSSGSEYGVAEFGTSPEYGLKTMQWIERHYEPVHLIRYRKNDPFGIDILKLKANP